MVDSLPRDIPLIRLAAFWTGWCVLHSLLIASPVRGAFQKFWGPRFPRYRLLYNLISLITLLPLWAFTRHWSTAPGVLWEWPYTPLQGVLVLLGLGGFWAGARSYDLRLFAGLRPEREDPELQQTGILGLSRHPWYTAALLLLWAQKMDAPILVMTLILSVYLIVGAFLEERKLVRTFGSSYEAYRRQVSMFFPFKWIGQKIGAVF